MKRLFIIGLAFLLLGPPMIYAEENKKIAVASTGKTVKAPVSTQAARSPYYLLFDIKGKLIQVLDNPYRHASRGAGSSAACFLSQNEVTIVIAGNFGPKMIHNLKNKDITYLQFKGLVGDAVKKALEGRQ